jgi:AraC-like DNA-binding protein
MADVVADIVADVVATTRRGTLMYARNRFHAPWGASFPDGLVASLHVIAAGACWLTVDGHDPVQLTRGDVVLIPSGIGHRLSDVPDRPARPMTEIAGRTLEEGPPDVVVVEGDGPLTVWLCGGFRLAPDLQHPLTGMLPPVVVVTAAEARGTGLGAAVDLLSAEIAGTDPGAPAVMASLVDLLFVYILRAWLAEHREESGWGKALFDPAVGAALALVHDDPARPWTLESLAREAGLPRATFSRRFAALTGQSPMAYVTAWRMALAARMLRDEPATLHQIAQRVGYESEFAFARAFKRTTGQAPGHYRKRARDIA